MQYDINIPSISKKHLNLSSGRERLKNNNEKYKRL